MTHAGRISKTPDAVTGLVQSVKEAKENYLLMNGYPPGPIPRSWYYLVAFTDKEGLGMQYYPPNDKMASYGSRFLTALDDRVISYINKQGLFTAYRQKKFEKKYILAADQVRKYLASEIHK